MNSSNKFEEYFVKYGLTDLREAYFKHFQEIETRLPTIGIWGEGRAVLETVAELFDLAEMKDILFPAEFYIGIQYGESKKYCVAEHGDNLEVPLEEFAERLQNSSDLTNEEYVFAANLFVPHDALKTLSVTARTIPEDVSDETLLAYDVCALALSATHMLSARERNLIKHPFNTARCYFLSELDKIQENEHEHVISLLRPYSVNGEKCYIIPLEETPEDIFARWRQIPNLEENRKKKLDASFKPLIALAIREKLSAIQSEGDKNGSIVAHLEAAKEKLPEYRDKTVRHVTINYIDNIKTDAASDILRFYEKMEKDITEGIREEKNVKGLQEELPHFISGAWGEFVENILTPHMRESLETVSPAIEEYVNEKAELFLKEVLTDEEFQSIRNVVYQSLGDRAEDSSVGKPSANTELITKENAVIRGVLPKALMALGGVVLLSSSILPGALLIAAGYKGNCDVVEETQNELIAAGKQLNHNFLKETQSNLDDLMSRIKAEMEVSVEQCYSKVIDSLVQMIHSYHIREGSIDKEVALINADLVAL